MYESAGVIGQSTTKSRLRVRGLDAAKTYCYSVRFCKTSQISECQWHVIISLPFLILLPFHHSPSLQSRRKRPEGIIRSLFCLEVWTLIWIASTSNFSNVFCTVCGFTFWHVYHVLTHSHHHQQPLKRSIADVSSPLLFLKTQRLPWNRRSLYLESQSFSSCWNLDALVFLKCSHGGLWFAFLVATGVFFLAANTCKSYIMIMVKLIVIISCQLPGDSVQLPSLTWGAADGDGHTLVAEFSTITDCLPRMAFQKQIFRYLSMYLHYSHLAMTHDLISWSIMTLFFLLQPWFTNSWNITVWVNSWTQVSGFNSRRLRCSFAAFPAVAALVPLGRQRAARPRKTRRSCQNVRRIRLGKPDDLRWSEIRRRENRERMRSRERQIMANAQRYFEIRYLGLLGYLLFMHWKVRRERSGGF